MRERGWHAARLDEIPSGWDIPVDDVALGPDEAEERIARQDPRAIARWNAFEARYPGIWDRFRDHDVRRALGIRAFGVAAFGARSGDPVLVPHSESAEGYAHEELYVLVRGRARFTCDGDEIDLAVGDVLFVRPEVFREAVALETPTLVLVLVVGGVAGEAYTPPAFHLDHGFPPPEE